MKHPAGQQKGLEKAGTELINNILQIREKVVSLQPHKKSRDFLVQWGSVGDALFMEFRGGTE